MPRTREHAILILSPSRMELATPDGRVESMAFDSALWKDALSNGLRPFDHWFTSAATDLGLRRRSMVTIAVTGTSLRYEVCHHTGSEREINGTAHASMAEQFEHHEGLYQVAVSRLQGRPEPDSGAARFFFSAECDAVLDSMIGFVERAGFRCRGVTSLALAHAGEVSRMLSRSPEQRIVCDIGEHDSIIAVGGEKAVPLLRPFGVGAAAFIDVYRRLLEPHDRDAASVFPRARELVFRRGVPARDLTLDSTLGLTGRDVLPMLQPVIQRMAVEIKNTLRFGLSSRETEGRRVELTGLGSRIPGLASAIAAHLDVEIVAEPGDAEPDAPIPVYADVLRAAGRDHSPLRSFRLARLNTRERFDSLVRLGGLAAAVVLGFEALLVYADIRGTTATLRDLEPRLAAVRDYHDQTGQAAVLASELSAVRGVIDERVGSVARWAPALDAIADAIAENTRLTDCRGYHEERHAWLRFTGEITLRSGEERTLGALLDTIERHDMFDLLELESARTDQLAGEPVQRFTVRVRLVTEPAAPDALVIAFGPGTPQQPEGVRP